MKDFRIEPNNRIEVLHDEKYYKSLVIETGDNYIRISIPVYNEQYLFLNPGEEVDINSYLDESQCYNFYCDVVSRGKDDNISYYELTNPYNVTKIQRRDFYRVQMLENVKYKIVTDVKEDNLNDVTYKTALMIDLSGGGSRIQVKEHLQMGSIILLNMGIEEIELELKCEVVRVEKTEDNMNICGVKFINITDLEVDKIMKKLFDIMRRQRANQ